MPTQQEIIYANPCSFTWSLAWFQASPHQEACFLIFSPHLVNLPNYNLNIRSLRHLRALAQLAPFQFIFGIIYSWGVIASAIHQQIGWSTSMLNFAFSLTPLALFPTVMFAGRKLDNTRPKRLLFSALTLYTLGILIGTMTHSQITFVIGVNIIALGIGAGLSTASCITIAARIYPTNKGTTGGFLLALYGMSSVVSAPLFHILNMHLSWRLSLMLLLGGYASFGWLAWLGLPMLDPPIQSPHASKRSILALFFQPQLRIALTGILLAAPFGSAAFANIGELSNILGFSNKFTVTAVTIMAFGNGLGRLGFGVFADRFTARRSSTVVLTITALAALILIATLCGLAQPLFMVFPLLLGLSFGGMAGKLPALSSSLVEPDIAHSAFGILFGAFAFASFSGPLISSVFDTRIAMLALSATALIAVLLPSPRIYNVSGPQDI